MSFLTAEPEDEVLVEVFATDAAGGPPADASAAAPNKTTAERAIAEPCCGRFANQLAG